MADDPIEVRVSAWIQKGGIPLEYEVARVLVEQGFAVAQGRGYPSTVDGVTRFREIDVIGDVSPDAYVRVSLVVECKHTEGKPWLILTNRRILSTGEVLSALVAHTVARDQLKIVLDRSASDAVPAFLRPRSKPGFSVVVALDSSDRDDRNRARDAMAQAVSAANGVVSASQFGWSIAWPVVVVDGPLLELTIDDEGSEVVQNVDWQRLLWYASPFGAPVAVDIVTALGFASYAGRAWAGLGAIESRLSVEYRRVTTERSNPDGR
jgi:hypothetical protein